MNERKITGWLARGGIVAVILGGKKLRVPNMSSPLDIDNILGRMRGLTIALPALSPYNCCGWGDGGARGAREFKHRVGVEMGMKG